MKHKILLFLFGILPACALQWPATFSGGMLGEELAYRFSLGVQDVGTPLVGYVESTLISGEVADAWLHRGFLGARVLETKSFKVYFALGGGIARSVSPSAVTAGISPVIAQEVFTRYFFTQDIFMQLTGGWLMVRPDEKVYSFPYFAVGAGGLL